MKNEKGTEMSLPLPKAFPYILVTFILVAALASLRPVIVETSFAWGTIAKCTIPVTVRAGTGVDGYLAGLKLETGEETQIWLQNCREGERIKVQTASGFWPFGQKYEATDT